MEVEVTDSFIEDKQPGNIQQEPCHNGVYQE